VLLQLTKAEEKALQCHAIYALLDRTVELDIATLGDVPFVAGPVDIVSHFEMHA
jgi:hypothetical protein